MAELLFEIGTEELPSWYVTLGREALAEEVAARLEAAQLAFRELHAYATPRRLAVRVHDLAERSRERVEQRRGPAESVAFGDDGTPTRAALGFAAANGVAPEDLRVEDTDKGRYVFARQRLGGEPASELLPPLLARLVAELPAPRKMRWADVDTPFVRPVAWLVALLDDEVLPLEAAGVRAGRETRGHRFLAPEPISLARPGEYLERLEGAFVLADPEVRERATAAAAAEAAAAEGLTVVDEPQLRAEVANLVEYPFGVLGAFEERYLELPEEVLSTVMIHHQRFFPTRGASGALAPRFVSVSNNRVPDPAVIREGYQQVLEGRLYDARFFWDADRGRSLSQHAWGLSGIGFQQELGSMADKVARVGEAAQKMAQLLSLSDDERATLEAALPIFRADLATDMVYELPELEGVMARAYAEAEGLGDKVATALEGGVMPKGPGQPLPGTRVGALLSVADRLDTLVGFFALGKRPTGSADPFGLRRAGVALARTLNAQGWRLPPRDLIVAAAAAYADTRLEIDAEVRREVEAFVWDRVASLLAEEGIPVSVVRAATRDRPPVITAARRAHLLQALGIQSEFPALMTLYKRATNLAQKAPEGVAVEPERFSAAAEAPLFEALPDARRGVEALLSAARRALTPWDLGAGPSGVLARLDEPVAQVLALKAPLDAFLDNVLVMVDDEAVRRNRLALLREARDTLRELGALEELEGSAEPERVG